MSSNTAKLIDTIAFAADKHRMQRRKDADASPYINHPIALARVLAIEAGIDDEDVLCAALLHDTIEDTETSREELEARFGTQIATIVAEGRSQESSATDFDLVYISISFANASFGMSQPNVSRGRPLSRSAISFSSV